MQITLAGIGKKFGRRWIFRDLNTVITSKDSLAICGKNGAGKSTLLKIIGGYHSATEGTIRYFDSKEIDAESALKKITFSGPDLHLIQEMTLSEHLQFHFNFKSAQIPVPEMVQRAGLKGAENLRVGEFSSGMKQRLKLLLSFFGGSDLLLLDEPTTFLDQQGIEWYRAELSAVVGKKTVVVASNQPHEYNFLSHQLVIDSK